MKIPKSSTIRKRFIAYAYRAGFTVHPHYVNSVPRGVPGTYSLFDIKMGYYTHRNISMDTLVRVVIDEMHMQEYNKRTQSV